MSVLFLFRFHSGFTMKTDQKYLSREAIKGVTGRNTLL